MLKPPTKTKHYPLRLDWDLAKWIEEYGKKQNKSFNGIINYILNLYRKSKEKKENA